MLRELLFAVRSLRQHRRLTVAASLSLAVGLGATATTFGWVDQLLLRPLPGVQASGDLFVLVSQSPTGIPGNLSHPDYLDIRAAVQDTAAVAATYLAQVALARNPNELAELVSAELVSDNYFETLGSDVALGRVFQGSEVSIPGAQPVVLLSDGLWRSRFGGDSGVLGRTLHLNGQVFTIVGVMSEEFRGGFVGVDTHLWVPLMMQAPLVPQENLLMARERRWLQCYARLNSDSRPGELRARVAAVSEYLTEQYASIQRGRTFFVTPIWQSPVGAQPLLRPVLLALSGLAVLLLLLACANVTNLLLARALQRRRDLAIRLALGSGRLRAVRHFFMESCLLAGAGGIGGVVLTLWAIGLLKLFPPPGPIAGGFDAEVDWAVLQLSTLLVVGVAMLIGLIPAIQSLRAAPMSVLRSESGFLTAGQARRRAGNVLAALQIAVCVAVLVGAGLSLRSLDRSRQLDLGFPSDNVLLTSYNLFLSGYGEEAGMAFHQRILRRLSAVPAVSSVSLASAVPFALTGGTALPVDLEGYTPRPGEDTLLRSNVVAPDYFRTMAIPLVRGRAFEERDDRRSPLVTIVSQTVANRYWPDREPVGQTIRFPTGERLEVVGVVADVRHDARRNEPPMFYVPLFQWYRPDVTLHFRTDRATSASVIADVRGTFLDVDPSVPLFNTTLLETQVRSSVFFEQFAASLSTVLAIVCLALTAIGVYSLLAYAVTERTVEIGLRVVLGAQRRDVVRIVLRQALLVMVTGLAFGTLGGFATAYLLASMLVSVDPTDGVTWAFGILSVTTIVIIATAIAARRATRIGATAAVRATG